MSETLRCHSCSHSVGKTAIAMRLAGVFKASLIGRVPPSHSGEVRKRCGACGWVNIFHPLRRGDAVETKG